MMEKVLNAIQDSIEVKQLIISDRKIINQIGALASQCIASIRNNNKVIFCGNGGSFGDSQHLSAEFTGKYAFDRNPMASVALGTNSSSMSAIGNDYGFENVFSRELEAIGRKGDILICITTSGNSKNIIKVLDKAKELEIESHIFTGNDGGIIKDYDNCIKVPSKITGRIQECHIMIGQIVCDIVESTIFKK